MSRQTTDADDLPVAAWLDATAAPADRQRELSDARELPPPEPLRKALETLSRLPDETVFVQVNDRAPKLLYPKLDDRGYEYETVTADEGAVTVAWK